MLLVSRNKKDLGTKEGALNLLGGTRNVGGPWITTSTIFIEHGKGDSTINQKHEAVAYLNRLGHLYYFTKSSFTKKIHS